MNNNGDHPGEAHKTAPAWAMEPFERFLGQTERLSQVLNLTLRGISVLRAMPKVTEAVSKARGEYGDSDSKKRLAAATQEAELAHREVDTGFPIVHSQAIVTLWSLLEALVHFFIVDWIKNEPTAVRVRQLQRLRIRLGDYTRLEGDDRYGYVVELLEKELATGLRNGVTRFEALLEPFGLSGEISDDIRQSIYELGQIRNVIVHRAAVVDRQLLDACPWLGFTLGDELPASHEMFRRYLDATHDYVILLICRVGEYFGVDMSAEREAILRETSTVSEK